jgi:hypothetical protein
MGLQMYTYISHIVLLSKHHIAWLNLYKFNILPKRLNSFTKSSNCRLSKMKPSSLKNLLVLYDFIDQVGEKMRKQTHIIVFTKNILLLCANKVVFRHLNIFFTIFF